MSLPWQVGTNLGATPWGYTGQAGRAERPYFTGLLRNFTGLLRSYSKVAEREGLSPAPSSTQVIQQNKAFSKPGFGSVATFVYRSFGFCNRREDSLRSARRLGRHQLSPKGFAIGRLDEPGRFQH